ncbi:uncharacterized protein DEA37_0010094 [Paragonimus westermani]|uniref:Uncharacterized protein n=1 Tax=Paragonimus westermani TaxID=34504 RepID=A0A5J4P2S3_9TREM|nr:uncharacterized protein DEA37_0010094 [Paragonimus westermani]
MGIRWEDEGIEKLHLALMSNKPTEFFLLGTTYKLLKNFVMNEKKLNTWFGGGSPYGDFAPNLPIVEETAVSAGEARDQLDKLEAMIGPLADAVVASVASLFPKLLCEAKSSTNWKYTTAAIKARKRLYRLKSVIADPYPAIVIPLYLASFLPHLDHCAKAWSSSLKKDITTAQKGVKARRAHGVGYEKSKLPRPNNLIQENRPGQALQPDINLQRVVYKLVPGLLRTEMQRLSQFCSSLSSPSSEEYLRQNSEKNHMSNALGEVSGEIVCSFVL